MNKEDLINKLENMNKPNFVSDQHQASLKVTLLNAKRSANIGILLVVLPCIFIVGVFFKYLFNVEITLFTKFEEWMALIDKESFFKYLIPLILIGAPLVGLIMNLLAIMHFEWQKMERSLVVTIKVKWLNIIISLICILILLTFFIYAIGENVNR